MYITAVPNRNSPPAILLREGYRENGKVKTRTLANLTHYKPERIEALKRALRGHFDGMNSAQDAVSDRSFGALYVLAQLAERVGLHRVLGKGRRGQLALFLILARLLHPGSRLSAVRWAQEQAVEQVLGLSEFDEQDLYGTLDWLAQEQSRIEDALYQDYVQDQGAAPSLVLYDVTSSYFEGVHNELAQYGYNRDKKRGKLQIVIGLLTSAQGEPLAVRVFEGNASDPTTVRAQIETLKERFGISELVFVGDRGMVKSQQKSDLGAVGLRYITALTNPQIRKLLHHDAIQMNLFDTQVQEVSDGGRRWVLRRNEEVMRKKQHRRADKLDKLRQKVEQRNEFVQSSQRANPQSGLKQLQAWLKRYKLHSFVTLSLSERILHIDIDEQAQAEAALLDGCYVLETDVAEQTMSAATVDATYRSLGQVERNFRMIKTGFLEVRPIFLRKANRTRAHVFVAMLALKILRTMQTQLSDAFGSTEDDVYAMTPSDALSALHNYGYLRYPLPTMTVLRLPKLNERQSAIFEALDIPAPKNRSVVVHS